VSAREANGYRVDVRQEDASLVIVIIDPSGREVSTRACSDETEARTYASTVRQHANWLSEAKFREYYRLPGPRREG